MATGELPEGLERELACPVCLELFNQPRRLSCGHTFCRDCLLRLVQGKSAASIRCPECRKETQLPVPGAIGVSRLTVDHRTARMVEMCAESRTRNRGSDVDDPDGDFADYRPASPTAAGRGGGAAGAFEHVDVNACAEVFDGYVPFELLPRASEELFMRWKSALWLSPTDFAEKAQLQVVRAAYIPFFVFSVDTHTSFRASVFVPQESGHKIPSREPTITTSVSRPPDMQIVQPTAPTHPSRRWKGAAVGMSVTQKMRRGLAEDMRGGWATWLWEHAAPWLSNEGVPNGIAAKKAAAGCGEQDGGAGAAACGGGAAGGPQVRMDNCEAQLKFGQTFVSATMPRERKIELSGRYSNQYANILVCASHAVDHDLVAGLMTGRSKDTDIATLRPLTAVCQNLRDYERYIRDIQSVVFGPNDAGPAGPASGPSAEETLDELFRTPAASRHSSPRRRPASPRGDSGADLFAFFEDTERIASRAQLSDLYGSGISARSPRGSPAAGAAAGGGFSVNVHEEHFGRAAGGAGAGAAGASARMLGKEVLPAERSSAEVWEEQILPHVRDRELGFTRDWVESQAPKGAVVDECETEMTVYSVEHRAVLLPCFLATYTYEGNWYEVVIHGRSGQVHGKRPWLGEGAYEHVRKGVQGHVDSLRQYLETSLDSLGM
eukprot:Hpha_TRINITY_DN14652_c0_g1::TRINITY_DN14652_c0_g1_i1::g.48644::m.48644